jgi:hypothetical protein
VFSSLFNFVTSQDKSTFCKAVMKKYWVSVAVKLLRGRNGRLGTILTS